MAIAHLQGGPLDGQILPLDPPDLDQMIVPYGGGQIVYRRSGEPAHTGGSDGPTETPFTFSEATDEIIPSDD